MMKCFSSGRSILNIRTLFGTVDGQQIDGGLTNEMIQAYAIMAFTGLALAGVSVLGFVKFTKTDKKVREERGIRYE